MAQKLLFFVELDGVLSDTLVPLLCGRMDWIGIGVTGFIWLGLLLNRHKEPFLLILLLLSEYFAEG